MNRIWLTGIILLSFSLSAMAQPKTAKKSSNKAPSQEEMNKLMEDAMKAEGMSAEEQAEMKKMMKGVMPALMEANAGKVDYPGFTSNKELIPERNTAKLAKMRKKPLTQAEVSTYAGGLLAKILAKAPAAEIVLIKKHSAPGKTANDIEAAAVEAMMQGHAAAALGLAMKAVQADPSNANYQNNMAAMLTQYGHPDLAMPMLAKLQTGFNDNSTIQNNLAYAWMGLGVPDSARIFAGAASKINPAQPDAKLCGGLMEELIGDPIKNYTESMENSVNPFTEQVLKNKGVEPSLDWEKIKRSIVIYEYFPANWVPTPPMMHNDVTFYDQDKAVIEAWDKMAKQMADDIAILTKKYENRLDNLADLGEEEFAATMFKEAMAGQSMMSKPAVAVLKVLFAYQAQSQKEFGEEMTRLAFWKADLEKEKSNKLSKLTDQMNRERSDCKKYKVRMDEVENDFMKTWNTTIHGFLTRKTEEFRQWLNAWVTWNWYVAGNIQGTVVYADLEYTAYYIARLSSIVGSQEITEEHCTYKRVEVQETVAVPPIPNFECPAVVAIPSGKNWQAVQAGAKNLDDNPFGIKADGPVPNVSIGYGIGKDIAQPGINPFMKTSDGSLSPSQGAVNSAIDRGLSKAFRKVNGIPDAVVNESIDKRLTEQIKKLNQKNGNELDELAPLLNKEQLRNAKIANELMKKMMAAPCAKKYQAPKVKFEVGFGELQLLPANEFNTGIGQLTFVTDDGATALILDDKGNTVGSYDLPVRMPGWNMQTDGESTIYHYNKDGILVATSETTKPLPASGRENIETSFRNTKIGNAGQTAVVNELKAVVKSIETNGLQPTISNSAQAPGLFDSLKNIFN